MFVISLRHINNLCLSCVTLSHASITTLYFILKFLWQRTAEGLMVEWNDGHKSEYSTKWLQDRSFTPTARALQRERYSLRRVMTTFQK